MSSRVSSASGRNPGGWPAAARIPQQRFHRQVLALLVAQALWAPALALADESGDPAPAPSGAASAAELDAVTVTGSRIARLDYASSSPLTTVTREQLRDTGTSTLEEALNQLPQLGPGANKTNAGWGGTGQATLNPRGLGARSATWSCSTGGACSRPPPTTSSTSTRFPRR